MEITSNNFLGKHTLGGLYNVAPEKLNDLGFLTEQLCAAATKAGATVCGTLSKQFDGAAEIQEFFQHRGWVALIVTYAAGIRHLDVVLGVIDAATMVYAEGSISQSDVLRLRAQGMECFAVDVSTTPFACNFVNLGNKRLLTCLLCAATKATFAQLGCTTGEVDVSAFIDDDGGPRCLIQCIARAHTKAPL